MNAEHTCIHEEQLNSIGRKTVELEARSTYHEKHSDELAISMKELKNSIESLDKNINEFILKSINDDGELKDKINTLNNRVVILETARKEEWKMFTGMGVVITIISFALQYIFS